MPRKVDFHTEWAIPDSTDCEDTRSDERKSDTPMSRPTDMQAAQAPKPQTYKWFVAGGPAY